MVDNTYTIQQSPQQEPSAPPTKRYISDLIDESYQQWNGGMRIVFDAGTNSGKTHFILNSLIWWALLHSKKILYLCNREPLREQVERDATAVSEDLIRRGFDFCPPLSHIEVKNYQWLETFYENNPAGAEDYLNKNVGYIVADEYHYLLTDASFNERTDYTYTLLNQMTAKIPVIFMSATAHPFFDRWLERGEVLPENYYHIEPDYSFVNRVLFYWRDDEELELIRQEARRGKVLVFVDSTNHLKKLKNVLKTEFPDEVATACSDFNREAVNFDGLHALMQGEKLSKRISIVTTVFYNGINIKDDELKCIITRLWNPLINAQILGRKRPLNPNDHCTVCFRQYSKDVLRSIRSSIDKKQLTPANKFYCKENDPEQWDEYIRTPGIIDLLDKDCHTIHREKYGNGWIWDRRAYHQYYLQSQYLDRMIQNGYQEEQLNMISGKLKEHIDFLRYPELEKYISKHFGEEIPREVMREEIVRLGHMVNPNDRHKDKKPPSRNFINKQLKCYGVKIGTKQKRLNNSDRATFWRIENL